MIVDNHSDRIKNLEPSPFINGPGEFLVGTCAALLKAVPEFAAIFGRPDPQGQGAYIDGYKRLDYDIRSLPALRIFSDVYGKETETWWVTGNLTMDAIFPATIRRLQTQQIPDQISAALLQQFRRPSFLDTVAKTVPGINELGKVFNVDKTMGFLVGDELVPMIRMTVNFKIDLAEWDRYLERDDRTRDDPFNRTLANLQRVVTTIQGLRDDGSSDVQVPLDQTV